MIKYSEQFAGDFLEAIALPQDKPVEVTIKSVEPANSRKCKDGKSIDKPILTFEESPKALILNKTNARALCKTMGNNMSAWVGKKTQIYQARVAAFGEKDVPAVRIWTGRRASK